MCRKWLREWFCDDMALTQWCSPNYECMFFFLFVFIVNLTQSFPCNISSADSWNHCGEQHSLFRHGHGVGAITQRKSKSWLFCLLHVLYKRQYQMLIASVWKSFELLFCCSHRVLASPKGIQKRIWRTWPTLRVSPVVTTLHQEEKLWVRWVRSSPDFNSCFNS